MEHEAKLMKSVKLYIEKHGYTHFFRAEPPSSKKKLFPESIKLPSLRHADIEEFKQDVTDSIEKHKKLYNKFKHIHNIEFLIHRYDTLGYLNNISLSVAPKLKEKWGINHELFGAFYNVNLAHTYCSLFPDLEPNSVGNVFFFKPAKGMKILANPPYTSGFIRWTCKKIIEWKTRADFVVVLPVWDKKTRDELKLPKQPDLHEIQDLIAISDEHRVYENLPFYDGINNRIVYLKDPVHVIFVFSGK